MRLLCRVQVRPNANFWSRTIFSRVKSATGQKSPAKIATSLAEVSVDGGDGQATNPTSGIASAVRVHWIIAIDMKHLTSWNTSGLLSPHNTERTTPSINVRLALSFPSKRKTSQRLRQAEQSDEPECSFVSFSVLILNPSHRVILGCSSDESPRGTMNKTMHRSREHALSQW